jgi:hypothetical protein
MLLWIWAIDHVMDGRAVFFFGFMRRKNRVWECSMADGKVTSILLYTTPIAKPFLPTGSRWREESVFPTYNCVDDQWTAGDGEAVPATLGDSGGGFWWSFGSLNGSGGGGGGRGSSSKWWLGAGVFGVVGWGRWLTLLWWWVAIYKGRSPGGVVASSCNWSPSILRIQWRFDTDS